MIALPDLLPLLPEIFILTMACVGLIGQLWLKECCPNFSYYVTQLALLGATLLTLWLFDLPFILTLFDHFLLDQVASLLKLFIYLTSFAAFLYSRHYIQARDIPRSEYYILGLMAVLGMMVMVSSASFITLFLGLELLSLPLYAMIAMQKDSEFASEAAIKYFVVGSLASAMFLYGISLFYGVTHNLYLSELTFNILFLPEQQKIVLILGLVFMVAGLSFKLGVVPFHMWVPDVYQGAHTAATLFVSAAPKIATLGLILRLFTETAFELYPQWQEMLITLAILSLLLGNVIALIQSNIKRMLAYSAIANMGFALLGLVAGTKTGYATAVFYVINYALMSAGAFGVLLIASCAGFETENISDLRGLNAYSPWLAFLMLLFMLAMAGIPPTVGFFAKLTVLQALVQADQISVAVLALLFSLIGAYYYLRVIKVMYFEQPTQMVSIMPTAGVRIGISVHGLLMLVLGLFPSGLLTLCQAVFS